MESTKIEWTATRLEDGKVIPGNTFNAWKGCAKVSPGCKNCYALDWGKRFGVEWGPGATRIRTSKQYWRKPYTWNKQAQETGIRTKVFCSSLADVFEDKPDQPEMDVWRAELLAMILDTPNIDWLLLTKRSQNILSKILQAAAWWHDNGAPGTYERQLLSWMDGDSIPQNIWLGTSVENQEMADQRIPHLLSVPAKIHFLSMEPLLGPVDLSMWAHELPEDEYGAPYPGKIDWVIVGGESGPNARPMHPAWARSIRNQCVDTGIPFFFKQWGEWVDYSNLNTELFEIVRDGGPVPHMVQLGNTVVYKFSKHKTGRTLDGQEWSQVPA